MNFLNTIKAAFLGTETSSPNPYAIGGTIVTVVGAAALAYYKLHSKKDAPAAQQSKAKVNTDDAVDVESTEQTTSDAAPSPSDDSPKKAKIVKMVIAGAAAAAATVGAVYFGTKHFGATSNPEVEPDYSDAGTL